tara:strand:- start:25671 stop:25958 length:288 start_codon:yes stop_codon:yes gene_type:complete
MEVSVAEKRVAFPSNMSPEARLVHDALVARGLDLAPPPGIFTPGNAGCFYVHLLISLKRTPFPADWWPLIVLCFLPSFLAIEADKALRKLWSKTA